jgi:hypothetical protein
MAYTGDELGGVGGWLAFFVIIIGIFTPLGQIVALFGNLYGDPSVALAYGDNWGAIQVVAWVLTALSIALALFMAYRLLKVETWETVRIVIAGIWALAIVMPAIEFLVVLAVTGMPVRDLFAVTVLDFVRGLVFGTIWTLYFLRSRRVDNTYNRQRDDAELVERFA